MSPIFLATLKFCTDKRYNKEYITLVNDFVIPGDPPYDATAGRQRAFLNSAAGHGGFTCSGQLKHLQDVRLTNNHFNWNFRELRS